MIITANKLITTRTRILITVQSKTEKIKKKKNYGNNTTNVDNNTL